MHGAERQKHHQPTALFCRQINHAAPGRVAKRQRHQAHIQRGNRYRKPDIADLHTEQRHKWHEQNGGQRRPVQIILPAVIDQIMDRSRDQPQVQLAVQKSIRQIIKIGGGRGLPG